MRNSRRNENLPGNGLYNLVDRFDNRFSAGSRGGHGGDVRRYLDCLRRRCLSGHWHNDNCLGNLPLINGIGCVFYDRFNRIVW